MRRLTTIICFICCAFLYNVQSQSVIISDDGSTSPAASSILELKSDSEAFLLPRLSRSGILAVASPATGLMLYNSDDNLVFVFNGSDWTDIGGNPITDYLQIGDYYQGGIIFYLDGLGGGYIAATTDVDVAGNYNVTWGCSGSDLGAYSNTDGAANTATIIGACPTANIAADLANSYSNDGYTDWYLPALLQLALMYDNQAEIGGFSSTDAYHSSTEISATLVYIVDFSNGNAVPGGRSGVYLYRVRPVRTF